MRNINIFERHFEKIAFGVVGLGMAAWVGWDLMDWGQGTVKLGGREVRLAQVDVELRKKADAVAAKQQASEVPESLGLADAGAASDASEEDREKAMARIRQDAQARADEAFGASVAGKGPLPKAGPAVASRLFSSDLAGRERWYHEPKFGPVSMVSPVLQWEGCVAAPKETRPEAGESGEKSGEKKETDLDRFLQSLDKRPEWAKGDRNVICAMPAATVDLKAIREEFKKAQEKATPSRAAVPASWRNGTITIIDVVFERQERQPDGKWGPSTLVPIVASEGRRVFRGEEITDPTTVFEAMRSDPALQRKILQPAFFELSGGKVPNPTASGSAQAAEASEPTEVVELRARLRKVEADKAKTESDLAAAGGEYRKPPSGGKGGGDSGKGGGKGGGGPGGGGPGGGATRPGNDDAASLRLRERLTRRLDDLNEQVKTLTAQIQSKLPKIDAAAAAPRDPEASLGGDGLNLNADDSVLVWTHDWSVRPGAEYRYRCQLAILNPFLGRSKLLVPEQRKLDTEWGDDILTEASAWVEVRAQSPSAFFVRNGTVSAGSQSLGASSVQVFRLIDGVWKEKVETVEPGDLLGAKFSGRELGTSLEGEWFVVAVLEDAAGSLRSSRDAKDSKASAKDPGERPVLVVVAPLGGKGLDVRRSSVDWSAQARRALEAKASDAETSGTSGSAPSTAKGG
jgi:hypothetical protein